MSLVDNSELPVGVNDYLYKLCRPSLDSASLVAGKCIQSFGSLWINRCIIVIIRITVFVRFAKYIEGKWTLFVYITFVHFIVSVFITIKLIWPGEMYPNVDWLVSKCWFISAVRLTYFHINLLTYSSPAFTCQDLRLLVDPATSLDHMSQPLWNSNTTRNTTLSQHTSMGHYWPACDTPSKWRFAGELIVARIYMFTGQWS